MDQNDIKSAAIDFLNMVNDGLIDEAYQKHVDMSGKHHNLFTPAGFEALKDGMKEADKSKPNKTMSIKRVVVENDTVITHSHLIMDPSSSGMIVVHILRFKDGKIIELWDVGQAIGDKQTNQDGAF